MRISKDWRKFIGLLNANIVEYVIVGGFAVGWHGHPRFTADIDFFVRPTAANAELVIQALQQFGFGNLQLTADNLSRQDQIVQLGVKPNRIDLITSIAGVTSMRLGPPGSLDRSTASRCRSLGATN